MQDKSAANQEELEKRERERQQEKEALEKAKKQQELEKANREVLEANTQTDIGMEWFDKERSFHK